MRPRCRGTGQWNQRREVVTMSPATSEREWPARVVVRPVATPLPLGFLALFIATLAFSALQLSWIDQDQGHTVALAVLGLTVPLQLVAAAVGFMARDPVAATGMGILAGTWASAGLAT